jgi:hypothetical protein
MYTPTTHWDRPPTDKELNAHYGTDRCGAFYRNLIRETITETVRTVNPAVLSLPYVKYASCNDTAPKIAAYPFAEVVTDYGTDAVPLAALMAVIAGSDCPLVAAYREALSDSYEDAKADELGEFAA